MTISAEQAKALVESIAGRFESREEAEQDLASRGFCETDTRYILDMIDMAHSRATMNAIGMSMRNMKSNVDHDPIFKAAVSHFVQAFRTARRETPAASSSVTSDPPLVKKPWWKFW